MSELEKDAFSLDLNIIESFREKVYALLNELKLSEPQVVNLLGMLLSEVIVFGQLPNETIEPLLVNLSDVIKLTREDLKKEHEAKHGG